jgi:hypothetical protein
MMVLINKLLKSALSVQSAYKKMNLLCSIVQLSQRAGEIALVAARRAPSSSAKILTRPVNRHLNHHCGIGAMMIMASMVNGEPIPLSIKLNLNKK